MFYRNKNKTAEYREYQQELGDYLMGETWPFEQEPVIFLVTAGLSNRGADLDNLIKPLLDTYQSHYPEFNDNKVYGIYMIKDIVPKGSEYLDITVRKLDDDERKQDSKDASALPQSGVRID